jgi:signal peptide peptidase SppA
MRELLAQLDLPRFDRLADYVGVWAIEDRAGMALLEQARRVDWAAHLANAPVGADRKAAGGDGPQTVKSNGQTVAVVTLVGTLQKAVSSMSGGTSTVEARRQIRKAAQDPEVGAILLAIDSPGGTVAGTMELAADVRAAAQSKPVWAFADDLCASAAYWVAAAADKVFANNRTALVGSIGTLSVVYDLSGAAEMAGIKTLVFGTGPLKGAGAPGAPITEDQQAYIRGIVEDAQVAFDAAVRKGRSLTDNQLAAVKSGGVFGATEAQDRKLIDGVKGFDQVVAELAAEAKRFQRASAATRAAGPIPTRRAKMDETVNTPAAGATGTEALPADVSAAIQASRQATAAELRRQAEIQKAAGRHPAIAADVHRRPVRDPRQRGQQGTARRVHGGRPDLAGGRGRPSVNELPSR